MSDGLEDFGIGVEQEREEHSSAFRDPITGELVKLDDVDGLIDAYERADNLLRELRAFTAKIRVQLYELSVGDTKTRRIRGQRRRAKVVQPNDVWDQSILKEAWNSFPHLRDEALQIERLKVRIREWNKIKNETGPDDFLTFRAMLEKANRGPQGLPKIEIEQ